MTREDVLKIWRESPVVLIPNAEQEVRVMHESKYDVFVGIGEEDRVASDMDLNTALLLTRAMFDEHYNEKVFSITIKKVYTRKTE